MTILAAWSGSTCSCSISVSSDDHVAVVLLRHGDADGRRIERLGGRRADEVVDRGGDALGGGEVGIAQRERSWLSRLSAKSISRSMMRAVGDAADGRHAAHDLGGLAFGLEAADRDRALADRVDVAVGAEQRRHQQRAALQALGVAERRDGDVDARALRAEGGRLAVTITAATLPVRSVCAADVDAEPLQHRLQRLLGEGDVVERVAGAVEADHEAVADELVLAHALDVGEVLDARRRARRAPGRTTAIKITRQQCAATQRPRHHCSPM